MHGHIESTLDPNVIALLPHTSNGFHHVMFLNPADIICRVQNRSNTGGRLRVPVKGLRVEGHYPRLDSLRLYVFSRSLTCACCGIQGNIVAVDFEIKQPNYSTPHYNLYHWTGEHLILMTKDHIIPKSKGGVDHLYNLQTMCENCNHRKGNAILT